MAKKYNIGVDIGTASVGWAVVEADTQKLIRKGDKKLWGVRLWEVDNYNKKTPAATRRSFRSARRRYDRRRYRIKLLQEEFTEEINKVDPTFFTKLKESFYHDDDLQNKTVHLSKEEKEQVKNYNSDYKTIYHLRNALIKEDKKLDIRLVYLAIHHILKYRGNFMYDGSSFNVNDLNLSDKLQEVFEQFENYSSLLDLADDYMSNLDYEKLEQVLLEESKNDRKIKILEELKDIFPKKLINEFTKMINGNKFCYTTMLNIETDEKIELSFKTSDYEDNYEQYEKVLKEQIETLESLKELYDMLFLKQLFKGSENASISELMILKYNQHKEDLSILKQLFKDNKKIYCHFFKNKIVKGKEELCVYEKYVNNALTNEAFINEINKYLPDVLANIKNQELIDKYTTDIKIKMENGIFLPRITEIDNGKYPYQLNKDELNKIIENQGKHYPFLLKKYNDKTYRITRLLEFRIPYYVGPLTSEEKSPFAWVVRKDNDTKITPYNFDEVIDKEATAEKFIKRMISNCTYLLEEKAMPNNSILYSKFKVMNELKQISVNGRRLEKEMQHKIYNELFLKTNKTITDTVFKEYLYRCKDFDMYKNDFDVKGYSADNKFANDMKSYVDFFGENGIFEGTNYSLEDAEQIIEWITIFKEKDILENKVRKSYNLLTDDKIKIVLNKKYSGWSNLSKKLLTEMYYTDKESGINKSIIDLMGETEKNFMQIINDEKYKFQEIIAKYNNKSQEMELDYSIVENLVTSPSTKRGIYQSLRVIKEIVDYIGTPPESIVIEMARSNDKKGRKTDRKKYLEKLYDDSKDEIENYNQLSEELKNYDEYKSQKIDQEKLFLYFIQEGKSLYSPTRLYIEDFDKYQIDHIIPQTLIKDDSIENKALVLDKENQDKAASFVLPKEYRTETMIKWWQILCKHKLMTTKKYNKLIRSSYREEDINGFINRQLVETRQITKHVANILKGFYKNTKIIYLKANLSHNYREKYKLYKFRDINDYHHAHDAYLAAVLGEYKEKYLKRKVNFDTIKELNEELIKRQDYKLIKYGYVINSLDYSLNELINKIVPDTFDEETGELLTKKFDAERFNKVVENTLYQNDILISKKVEFKTGAFYDQKPIKKGKTGLPLKKNLPIEKYGAYNGKYPSYAVMVKYTKKGKEDKKLIGIPIYFIAQEKESNNAITNYIKTLLELSDNDTIEMVSKKIPFYSLLDWDGQICYLVGATDTVEVCNAKEFNFSKDFMINHKDSMNKLFNNNKMKVDEVKYSNDLIEIIKYIVEKINKEYKLYKNLIPQLKGMLNYDNLSLLTIEKREKTVKELMNLLKCNSANANFKFLNEKFSSAFGKKHGRTIETTNIIYKSTTGIKEAKYEL